MNFINEIWHLLGHPLTETLKMSPVLFLAYLFMEWLEHTGSSKLTNMVHKSRRFGPLFGSALGLIPQCGFSGGIAGMFAAGTVTTGTLLAVILATSDEMLPLMISARLDIGIIIFIIAFKFITGAVTGFAADLVLRKKNEEKEEDIHGFCEREKCDCKDGVFLSALKHTLKILIIIFAVSVALHLLVDLVPDELIRKVLNFPVISQAVASLIGLIPSCAVSVTLTQLYIDGALGLSPLLCGLLSNGGVGLLVLYRVNRNRKENLTITLVIFLAALVFGSLAGFLA